MQGTLRQVARAVDGSLLAVVDRADGFWLCGYGPQGEERQCARHADMGEALAAGGPLTWHPVNVPVLDLRPYLFPQLAGEWLGEVGPGFDQLLRIPNVPDIQLRTLMQGARLFARLGRTEDAASAFDAVARRQLELPGCGCERWAARALLEKALLLLDAGREREARLICGELQSRFSRSGSRAARRAVEEAWRLLSAGDSNRGAERQDPPVRW